MKILQAEIMFGLVSVPVKYTGVVNGAAETRLRNLHAKCLTPIQNKAWCPTCKKDAEELVKGLKVGGKYVAVPEAELEATKAERSNVITITKFVAKIEVVAEMFYKHYHLIPDKHPERYALLASAMVKRNVVGIGSSCLAGKERPVIVHPHLGFEGNQVGLMLTLAHVIEDLVVPPYVPPKPTADKMLTGLANDLIEQLSGTIETGDLSSESRVQREALVESILDQAEEAPLGADLMAMLRASVGRKKVKV